MLEDAREEASKESLVSLLGYAMALPTIGPAVREVDRTRILEGVRQRADEFFAEYRKQREATCNVLGGPWDAVTVMAHVRITVEDGEAVTRMQQAINVMHGYPSGKVPLEIEVTKEHEDAHFRLMRGLQRSAKLPLTVEKDGTIRLPAGLEGWEE
jgi:hypothetical protein